jgi:hypothetical protein
MLAREPACRTPATLTRRWTGHVTLGRQGGVVNIKEAVGAHGHNTAAEQAIKRI